MHIAPPNLPCLPATGGPALPAAIHPRGAGGACQTARPAATPPQLRSTHGDFDAGRVQALRESLRSGTHAIDFERIADGMLSHLRDLGPQR